MSYRRLSTALLSALTLSFATAALAQFGQEQQPRPRIWVGGGGYGRMSRERPKFATRANFDGRFNFCRGYMEDVGTARFSDEEVANLRAYLLKGGFLEVDDFWGSKAWEQWAEEIGRVLPPNQYPIFDIPPDHAVLHSLYDVKEVEQVSNIRFWMQTRGSVSERQSDSPQVNFRGIQDERGRLMVVMAHNTDIPDTWEREGESQDYFDRFSPNGYAVGVNIMIYAMTH